MHLFYCFVLIQLCLTEDKPICAICKLFGDHESHSVAKISKVYAERKSRLVKELDWMLQHSQWAEQAKKVQIYLFF